MYNPIIKENATSRKKITASSPIIINTILRLLPDHLMPLNFMLNMGNSAISRYDRIRIVGYKI